METKDYLRILREEIHSTVIATVDKDGRPVTRVIDIMLTDENSLYFITAKGKAFYAQLMENPYVAISGMCGGEGTMNKKAVSIRGKAVNIGSARLKEVFQKNPYMAEIYPQEESRTALEVFQVAEGTGEFFDLSVKPIFRDTFVLGGSAEKEDGSAAGEAGQTRQGREKAPGNATGSRADISLRTGATDAASAAADVPRNVSICLQNRLSFSRSTACTAETAWRSVRLERWREDKKKRMKYREKRRTADFIHAHPLHRNRL